MTSSWELFLLWENVIAAPGERGDPAQT